MNNRMRVYNEDYVCIVVRIRLYMDDGDDNREL